MLLSPAQQQAVEARGNVLVVAGAGTGKTSTLVERCLDCLTRGKQPASLDEILVVSFTEDAAAEMRQRIRLRLEEEQRENPSEPGWQEQLALFDNAFIGTLHGFCLRLVKQHFYELDLDPQLAVMADEEAHLLRHEILDKLLQKYYDAKGAKAERVQELIQIHGGGSDHPIRKLVWRLHDYTQTRPDPDGWIAAQRAMFAGPEPERWRQWLHAAIPDWHADWLPRLRQLAPENGIAAKSLAAMLVSQTSSPPAGSCIPDTLNQICAAFDKCPHGKKTAWTAPLEHLRKEAAFLASLTTATPGCDPLTQDWQWVAPQMAALLDLASEFTNTFQETKRELGLADFHDLEQFALKLLWDTRNDRPTSTALQWREKLRFVFVDEYQDINAAQDRIIRALSRDGANANRFLVGDVKQSIYRFRLAEPHIFQGYVREWSKVSAYSAPDPQNSALPAASAIHMVDNFRSRERILNFINSLFGLLMRAEVGGVDYDENAHLRFGAPIERRALALEASPDHCVELHIRFKRARGAEAPDDPTANNSDPDLIADLQESEKEARMVALRLMELKAHGHKIWDEETKQFRAVDWSDMAILLRSPSGKSEGYAKVFSRLNIPLVVERGGFYESIEISDLLSLLRVLDNPLQDVPLLALLHSPLVGLTINELATIRLAVVKAPFWTALNQWHRSKSQVQSPKSKVPSPKSEDHRQLETQYAIRNTQYEGPPSPEASEEQQAGALEHKVHAFLDRFARWRRLTRRAPVAHCLEAVLTETHFDDWLLTQPRGQQRHANIQRLLSLARRFGQLQRQGLLRFLAFVEAQQEAEAEPEVATVGQGNSVRLMSIHKSKGLEFPVGVVADLGKSFNVKELQSNMILDEVFGLAPQIKPPHTGRRYPSLPFWLARRRQRPELLGEELRLLYVATTRARDLLILSASIEQKKWKEVVSPEHRNDERKRDACPAFELLAARSHADWLTLWLSQLCLHVGNTAEGEHELFRWIIHDDNKPSIPEDPHAPVAEQGLASAQTENIQAAELQALLDRLSWTYSFSAATRQQAKTSVSALRRQHRDQRDSEQEVALFRSPARALDPRTTQSACPSPSPPLEERVGERRAFRIPNSEFRIPNSQPAASPLATGAAHHKFLQFVSLACADSVQTLRQEAARLARENVLSHEEVGLLDYEALAAFWNSDLGSRIRAQSGFVRRELAFTARFRPNTLPGSESATLSSQTGFTGLGDDFVVVQGVADLVVLRPDAIWLVDFKTDSVHGEELASRIKEYEVQVRLYADALSRIYGRPVTECWLYFLSGSRAVRVDLRTG